MRGCGASRDLRSGGRRRVVSEEVDAVGRAGGGAEVVICGLRNEYAGAAEGGAGRRAVAVSASLGCGRSTRERAPPSSLVSGSNC